MSRRATPEFRTNRLQVLQDEPNCYWCKRNKATEADHLIEVDAGGTDSLDNLVPSCKQCNARRGAQYLANKRTMQMHRRERNAAPLINHGISQTDPRDCENCGMTFVPDWRNVARGGGKYCSRQCAGQASRLPRWTITTTYTCSICEKPNIIQYEATGETEPTPDKTPPVTCGSKECDETLNAIAARERYRQENPNCQPRASKYGERKPQTITHDIQVQETQKIESFLINENAAPPTPFSEISENGQNRHEITQFQPLGVGVGSDLPRLCSPTVGYESFGGLVASWSAQHLGRELFPWQRFFLEHAFQHNEQQVFVHSTAIASTARQNGKTSMLAGVVGWALSELPRIWGRPVRILSTAHELSLATEVFEELRDTFELWEESDLCKVTWAYGRHKVVMADGSTYVVKAATGKKHGGTYDIILADELWAITEAAYFGALKPSQIAVPSPLAILTSTAGDESSRVMLRLREQALGKIDSGEVSSVFMAEWSLPPDCDPDDPNYWGYANPSLGKTITVRALEDACAAPDRSMWLRAHCNLWVAAASSWLPPGMWGQRRTDEPCPTEVSVLAVDSSVDDSKYVGIRCGLTEDKRIVATVEFVADSSRQMWAEIEKAMSANPKLRLGITPSLDIHTPEKYTPRKFIWGYAELLKYTGLVRAMIFEGTLVHTGEEMLAEHVSRAVLTRAQNSVVLSSQKSPGNIECARCLIAAASHVSRPTNTTRPSMGMGRG